MIGRPLRDLSFGARMTLAGGRSGWAGTLLTALGVALGVAVLLLASSLPTMRAASQDRMDARAPVYAQDATRAGEGAVLVDQQLVEYRGAMFGGLLLEPLGDPRSAVLPPGLDRLPAAGELHVSPALRDLLASPEGALLAERFGGAPVAGVIGDEGLRGPRELRFYLGSDALSQGPAPSAASGFGSPREDSGLTAATVLLTAVVVVVLLLPVAAFVLAATRFGARTRDRRLAALRLVGADRATTRRIAAGESLVGALLGLVGGAGLFLAVRPSVGGLRLPGAGALPADVTPVPLLAAAVAVLVPAAAVAATLIALRGVDADPLGVVRTPVGPGRRLWWRVLPVALGCAVLSVPAVGPASAEAVVVVGVVLTLAGTALLLPWAVEFVVGRLGGGPLSWQLAARRLRLDGGPAARTVSGVTLAVAGAIALQMMLTAVGGAAASAHGGDPAQADLVATAAVSGGGGEGGFARGVEGVPGVESSVAFLLARLPPAEGAHESATPRTVVVGDCAALGRLIGFGSCAEGDAFVAGGGAAVVREGDRLDLNGAVPGAPPAEPRPWTVPRVREADAVPVGEGLTYEGLFLTPSAAPLPDLAYAESTVMVGLDRGDPDTVEHVRNHIGIGAGVRTLTLRPEAGEELAAVSAALRAGAILVMLVIGASLVVSTVEQLRERRRQLAALAACGTPRSTLAASVLWQTAVPLVIGLAIAVAGGLGTGFLLQRLVGLPQAVWPSPVPLVGTGLGVIALVTLASLPSLWRVSAPEGLRAE